MNTMEKVKDPAFWQAVREKECYRPFRETLLQYWQDHCCQPIEELPYSKIKLYFDAAPRR